jgi:hypothetical protein
MPLRKLCAGVSCPDGETCFAGVCAADAIDPSKLVVFSDALVTDTSFCVSPHGCFEDVVPALLANDRDCTFQLPDWAHLGDHMNVELLHADLSREILDVDAVEGFTRIDESHFRIAPNVCARYLSRDIAALYVGANCNPKSPIAPVCSRDERDAGPVERTLCTSEATLLPSRAAIYILLDRTRSMEALFGPPPIGLGEPLDLVLRWALHRRTLVGLRALPATAAACTGTSNPFATPTVALGPVEQTRGAIRALVDSPGGLGPDTALFADAALRSNGAYAALAALPDVPLRHVLFLGNRDFGPHCTPPLGTAADLAFAAFTNQNLFTSAIVLKAPPGAPQFGRDVYADAIIATRAGHGVFFDGTPDDAAMRLGLVTTFVSLASCLYDVPDAIDPSGDLSAVKLSYFDLISSKRVDIDRNAACSEIEPAPGWNLEGRRVRLCGKACNDLRLMLTLSAQYAVDRHLVPIDVPLKWAAPCR